MGGWLQDRSFVEKMRQCQEAIAIGDDSVQKFHIHSENIVGRSRKTERVGNAEHVICIFHVAW